MYKLRNYPLIQQLSNYDCGVATVQSVLLYEGKYINYKELEEELKTSKEDGTSPKNINMVLEGHKVKTQETNTTTDIQINLLRNKPTIVCVHYKKDSHYCSIIGFDQKGFLLHDPNTKKEKKIPYERFIKVWYNNYALMII